MENSNDSFELLDNLTNFESNNHNYKDLILTTQINDDQSAESIINVNDIEITHVKI